MLATTAEDVPTQPEIPEAGVTIMPGVYTEDGWVDEFDETMPRGPVNPDWRDDVVNYAASRQYPGFIQAISNEANEKRFFRYREDVRRVIFLCQGPRTFKTNIDMVATYCATALCSDRAQDQVQSFLDKHRRLPMKRELFELLEDDYHAHCMRWDAESSDSSEEPSCHVLSDEAESAASWTPDYMS